MAQIVLATESAVGRAPQENASSLLNYLVEKAPEGSISQAPLFAHPGIKPFTVAGNQPCRGFGQLAGTLFAVQGDGLWRILANGDVLLEGTGINGTGPVDMADNGLQLAIVNGQKGWIFDHTTGLQHITDPAFEPARTVEFFDGYFVFDKRGTNEFFLSDPYDGLSYNGLAFASAEAQPGKVVATRLNLQLLYVFTTSHIELWYDAGATGAMPFARYSSDIPYATESPYSIAQIDGALWFLGSDKIFYRLQGNRVDRVSTHAIEHFLAQESDLTKVECFAYTIEGHKIISMSLPTVGKTFGYDVSTSKWHDRMSVDGDFNELGRWRARNTFAIYDKILVGDAFDGRIGYLDWSVFKEYELPMRGRVRTLTQNKDRHNIFCSRLELQVQAGLGAASGQASDPQMRVRKSVDGGMTYSLWQQSRSAGRIGEYGRRLRWLRQGKGRDLMWEIENSDDIPWAILGAYADLSEGLA